MTRINLMRSRAQYFSLGRITVDQKSAKKLAAEDIIPALSRHICGDWGKVTSQRRNANRIALHHNRSLCSVYFSMDGIRFRVVTNAERSLTSVQVI